MGNFLTPSVIFVDMVNARRYPDLANEGKVGPGSLRRGRVAERRAWQASGPLGEVTNPTG